MWQRNDEAELASVEWAGHVVLYHRRSGQTHFLNAPTVRLLFGALQQPCSIDDAVRAMNSHTDGDPASPVEPAQILGLLRRLEELGLVRRAENRAVG